MNVVGFAWVIGLTAPFYVCEWGSSAATWVWPLNYRKKYTRAVSSVGSERLVYTQEVTGSNPVPPTRENLVMKPVLALSSYSRPRLLWVPADGAAQDRNPLKGLTMTGGAIPRSARCTEGSSTTV